MNARHIEKHLTNIGDPEKAEFLQGFFKTGPGEYAEGDVFIGIRVPTLRQLAKEHAALSRTELRRLIRSPLHEARLLALLIVCLQFKAGDARTKGHLYKFYLKHTRFINNWDLVDSSAHHVVGEYLCDRKKIPLYTLAKSKSLWERRIAMIATFADIRRDDFAAALRVAGLLLNDDEDLIHKAVGWMLREIGKRDQPTEEVFLKKYYKRMPRTMLRYAIERFPERKRQQYLRGTM